MAEKKNLTVVRNAAYTAGSIEVRERHNERKNENYFNADIIVERADMNVHYRQNFSDDGLTETYQQTFNRLLENGTIVKRGLGKDPKLFDEMIFDVNSAYFEERGGYDFAVKFYEEAYRQAVKEVGGEEYILSAVMHADEKNIALSEKLGRDVYHYHLHVIYVPVVKKEIRWSKRCKDSALVGTVKDVVMQISHSKKWPRWMLTERDGKPIKLNSYSLLQDRFFEHMREAGYDDLERGERGSTKEHLDVLDYKIQQDEKRLEAASEKAKKQEARLDKLTAKVTVRTKEAATIHEIDAMGKPALLGSGFSVTDAEMKTLKTFAKKGVTADERIGEARRKYKAMEKELADAKHDRDIWKSRYNHLWAEVKDFILAIRNFPQKLLAFINEHWQERRRERSQQKIHNREVL